MLLFKPLGLWSPVTAARADEHGDREMRENTHTQQQQKGLAKGNTAHGPGTTVCTPRKLCHGKASAANGEWMTSRVAQRACDSRRAGWVRSPPIGSAPTVCQAVPGTAHKAEWSPRPWGEASVFLPARAMARDLGRGHRAGTLLSCPPLVPLCHGWSTRRR